MMESLVDVRERVWCLLRDFPDCRDDDRLLLSFYLHKYCSGLSVEFLDCSVESITRARRYIQNVSGEFRASSSVAELRVVLEEDYKRCYKKREGEEYE